MAITSGSLIFLTVTDGLAEKKLVAEVSSELNITADMIETTNKDTVDASGNPVKTYIAGEQGYTFSVEGLYDPVGDWNATQIAASLKAGTIESFTFGGTGSGDVIFTGSGLFSSITVSGAKNEAPTCSAEIQGTGELVQTTVA